MNQKTEYHLAFHAEERVKEMIPEVIRRAASMKSKRSLLGAQLLDKCFRAKMLSRHPEPENATKGIAIIEQLNMSMIRNQAEAKQEYEDLCIYMALLHAWVTMLKSPTYHPEVRQYHRDELFTACDWVIDLFVAGSTSIMTPLADVKLLNPPMHDLIVGMGLMTQDDFQKHVDVCRIVDRVSA